MAKEASDDLISKSILTIIDAVCEGEVEAFPTPAGAPAKANLAFVYVNGIPMKGKGYAWALKTPNYWTEYEVSQKELDSFNFRTGTVNQTPLIDDGITQANIATSSMSANGFQVNQILKEGRPVERRITDQDVDALQVTLAFPRLSYQNLKNGNLRGTAVEGFIKVRANGGSWVENDSFKIEGKSNGIYRTAFRIDLRSYGLPPYDVSIERITPDSEKSNISDEMYWASYTEIRLVRLAYPHTAIAMNVFDSTDLSQVPDRAYYWKGMIVEVPSNYTPAYKDGNGDWVAAVYDEAVAWDGTFVKKWTANPAWAYRDIMTNTRYGLGNNVTTNAIDKWQLYTISKYNDVMVDNGEGGTEPRFSCSLYLQNRQQAYQVINDLTSIFRAVSFWGRGSALLVQQLDGSPVKVYTPSNVIDGDFTYSGTELQSRHTTALVYWNNPKNFFKREALYLEDTAGIVRYGINQGEIIAVGCISRSQAIRVGKHMILTDLNETEMVTFSVGFDSLKALPGNIIAIHDPLKDNTYQFGGRLTYTSADGATVRIDRSISVINGSYTIDITRSDGSVHTSEITGFNPVTTGPVAITSATDLVLSTPMLGGNLPVTSAVWAIRETSGLSERKLYRVVTINEADDDKSAFRVTAASYDPSKLAQVETLDALDSGVDVTDLSILRVETPSGIAVDPRYSAVLSEVNTVVQVSWTPSPTVGVKQYELTYSFKEDYVDDLPSIANPFGTSNAASDTEGVLLTTDKTSLEIPTNITTRGIFTVSVRAIGRYGVQSEYANASYQLKPPTPVEINVANIDDVSVESDPNSNSFTGPDANVVWRNPTAR